MNYVIIDHRMPETAKKSLLSYGLSLIEMPEWSVLQEPVSAHPDMLMFIADKKIITHADYYKNANAQFSLLSSLGYEIILSEEEISGKYPHDILFNCVEFKNTVFGKENSVSKYIKEYAQSKNKNFISVKQGYAKCSVAKVSENAAITADTTLYKAMSQNGIDTLLISEGDITLNGYDFGFIGGCSGMFEDTIYFSGNVDTHSDAEKIKKFCLHHGKVPVSLSQEKLFDGGSMFFV